MLHLLPRPNVDSTPRLRLGMALTLVPADLARPGHRFTFRGANSGEECRGCPFKRLCFGLEPGRTYLVRTVRDVVHPCGLHDPGKVRVVEVEQASVATTVETRLLRGTAVAWTPVDCGMPECRNFGLCHPVGPEPGTPHAVTKSGGAVDCPMGYDLTRVELRRM